MQMQPNGLAKRQQAADRVGRAALLNAGHLVAAKASGPGHFPDAPLASCLAHRRADLLGGHGLFRSISRNQACVLLAISIAVLVPFTSIPISRKGEIFRVWYQPAVL